MALGLVIPLLLALPQASYDPDPENTAGRWLVVYNANWPDEDGNGVNDSLEVAQHWLKKRRVPTDRLVAVSCSTWSNDKYQGANAWEDFWDEIVLPLRARALSADNDQVLGILFCYGVPYQVAVPGFTKRGLDTTLARLWDLGERDRAGYYDIKTEDDYADLAPGETDSPGRFDPSEDRFNDTRTYLVARLDGTDKHHAMELVDMALYGDVYLSPEPGHYQGRAYLDTQYGAYSRATLDAGYPFSHWTFGESDKALAYGRGWLQASGLKVHWEPNLTEIGEPGATWTDGTPALSAPNAMIYEGWYNNDNYIDVWDWMVGSFGTDLNSNSIARLRNDVPGTFVAGALRNGLTAGVGCVDEPYTEGHPYPEVFAYYMIKGYPFAEAARISDPRLMWTSLYVGDPMYQPFRPLKPLELDTTPPPPLTIDEVKWTGTAGQWEISTHLDTTGKMPDLAVGEVRWGTAPGVINQVVITEEARPRMFHRMTLENLPANDVVYFQTIATDPVGNVTGAPPRVIHTALETQNVVASLSIPQTTFQAGDEIAIEVALGGNDGFESLTTAEVLLTATHLGMTNFDIWPRLESDEALHFLSHDDVVRVARYQLKSLPPGTYTVVANVSSPAGTDSETLVLTVQ